MCRLQRICYQIFLFLILTLPGICQRQYASKSVLSQGEWYKVSTSKQGIYRIDATFLSRLGISLPVSSNQIRIFGNGGQMLPEANNIMRPDDLREISISVNDGGDGSFSGDDFLIFYAPGPDSWDFDGNNNIYHFKKNIYADSSWYFLTIGGPGKKITVQPAGIPGGVVTEFDDHFAFEKDTVNFLSGGKEWYGEEFGSGPGKIQQRDFLIPARNIVPTAPVVIYTDVIGRAAGQYSRFEVRLNRQLVQDIGIPPLPGIAYEPVAIPANSTTVQTAGQSSLQIQLSFFPGSVNGQGWLNRLELTCRRKLDITDDNQLVFRDRSSVGPGRVAEFQISGTTTGTRVWDITDPQSPVEQFITVGPGVVRFNNDCSVLREYVVFKTDRYLVPQASSKVQNQNLHQSATASLIIITHPRLISEATRIGEHHRQKDGLSYVVAEVQQVYNEFASGSPDPTAIRDYVKMFYDRAGTDTLRRPRYLLLFGDGSFDYKKRIDSMTGLVPVYESPFSLDPLTSYTSDDFFGLLDDNDDINSFTPVSYLDIGIGRVPASTAAQAKAYADKVVGYVHSFGPWRNQLTFVADDEDQNTHFNDAEVISATAAEADSNINRMKIYLDAYLQESGTGGSRYPQVNDAINRKMFTGNLIWNYSGHGGSKRLAQEAILDEDMVSTWTNGTKLPLFITATCDFAPYDDPLVQSIGDNILMRPTTGAIALMTTTRPVFAFANRIINNNYLEIALEPDADGKYLSLGEAVKRAKNYTYQTSSDALNNRKFTLLGDPALTLGFPVYDVVSTSINGIPASSFTDTIKALNRYTIAGEIRNRQGLLLQDFNGTVYPTLYDKKQVLRTRGNDPGSQPADFEQQQGQVFNGKAKVQNGRFSYTFIVPKDIDIRTGRGKLSYYADNGSIDAAGAEMQWYIGGIGNGVKDDGQGPLIRAFLNDEKFVNGGITNENAVLIIKIRDSSGINTAGTGIGHDVTAMLDNDPGKIFILNDFYEADTSYQSGTVRFPLPLLEEGLHSLKIKVWDVFNNSSEYIIEFRVVKQEAFAIHHVLNYPNPFTSSTKFWFEHNRPMQSLYVSIRIMTITGKVVKTIVKTIITPGNRSDEISWDGRDEYGAKLGRGVYLYQLLVRTSDGKRQQKLEKLVIL